MNGELHISNQPKHLHGLVLAGVVSSMSLFLPIGRTASEGVSTREVLVAPVGESRPSKRSPTLSAGDPTETGPVRESLSPNNRRPLLRPTGRGLETAPTGLGIGAEERARAIDKASAGQVALKDSEPNGALLNTQQPRATTYRYDDLNRLIEVIYADGSRITFAYDATGNLMQTITRPR